MSKKWVSIHDHTTYSCLDGYNKIKEFIKRAKELGMDSLGISDHGHLGACPEFQAECNKASIKPLLGVELYYTHDTNIITLSSDERNAMAMEAAIKAGVKMPEAKGKKKVTKKEIAAVIEPYLYDTKQYHILLLAMNQTGWHNLVKLQSEAARLGTFNGRFCCDDNLLRLYGEGLIMTTACVGSLPSVLINQGNVEAAKTVIKRWYNIFGDRMYLEIQPLQIQKQLKTNYYYMQWAKELNIKLVATTDCHYTYKEDWDDHDTLLCIGMGRLKKDLNRMKYDNEYWLKSYEEMVEGFEVQTQAMINLYGDDLINREEYLNACIEAIDNTNLIAERIENNIKLGASTPQIPNVEVPEGYTAEDYFMVESYKNLYRYYRDNPDINIRLYEKRLAYELSVINPKGFAKYMLIVKEYIDWCRENDIPVGPGRGSGAGSLALFVNGITQCIDPIKYDLLFFRFLTPDRTAMPDIDSDFSWANRDRVIEHLEDKYGKSQVSHIGLWSTLGVKSGLKDVGRTLDINYDVINNINKEIDKITLEDPETSFKLIDSFKDSPVERDRKAYIDFKAIEDQYPELFRLARAFEGCHRGMGCHASGILVTPNPISDTVPLRYVDGVAITLYTGVQLEELNYLKYDILGLKTLDILDRTIKSIDKDMTVIDLYKIVEKHLNDPEMFTLVKAKQTDALFQIESALFKKLSEEMQPDTIHDIIAMTSIGRPGPLSVGSNKIYAKNKASGEFDGPLPNTLDIVENTYGALIYQEQVMQIAKRVCGVDDNQADKLFRKAIAKKKKELLDLCRQVFIYGKVNSEAPEDYDENNKDQVLYDPKGKQGAPILGGINNGYDEEELKIFFESLKEYASYLFNKSHAACYSFTTVGTLYLMKYYPAKFLAAVLSMQDKQEDIDYYIKTARAKGLVIKPPHANDSNIMYSEKDGDIYVGLISIKGLGDKSIDSVIDNRPFNSIQDLVDNKIKKQVGEGLIMAGALDFLNKNRYSLLNEFHVIRKDDKKKKDGEFICSLYNEELYNKDICIEMEKSILSSSITYIPLWDTLTAGEKVEGELFITDVTTRNQRNGKPMAFVKGKIDDCCVDAVCFAAIYGKNSELFDLQYNNVINIKGHKDDQGKLVIDRIIKSNKIIKKQNNASNSIEGIIFNIEKDLAM